MKRPTIIERAFDLAGSGRYASVDEVARQLQRENYEAVLSHLAGGSLRRQLNGLIKQSAPAVESRAPQMSDSVG